MYMGNNFHRQRLVARSFLPISLRSASGIVIAYLVDYALSADEGWRSMFGVAAIPSTVLTVATTEVQLPFRVPYISVVTELPDRFDFTSVMGLAEEAFVFAAELSRALVSDFKGRKRGVDAAGQHSLSRRKQW